MAAVMAVRLMLGGSVGRFESVVHHRILRRVLERKRLLEVPRTLFWFQRRKARQVEFRQQKDQEEVAAEDDEELRYYLAVLSSLHSGESHLVFIY